MLAPLFIAFRKAVAVKSAAVAGILLYLILLLQGVPIQQAGTAKGVLRDSTGSPLPGVRMAAVARPDSLETIGEGTAMAGIAETDVDGRYTLENIPPGRYVIAAGRLDLQTYYPGTLEMAAARVILITPGTVVTDIDFVLTHSSYGRSPEALDPFGLIRSNATVIPLRVTVENRGKLPLSANGRYITVRLQSSSGTDVTFPVEANNVGISVPGPTDVHATVEDLPDYYSVQSVMYGTTDVTRGTFRVSPPPTSQSGVLSITLSAKPPVAGTGSRVTGSIGSIGKRLIYISGKPGVVYADGTFEFRDVPAGRHVIATVNNPSLPRAAVVILGDKDINGIELKETVLLPPDVRDPKNPLPPGNHPAGTTAPLARVSGVVLEELTKEPIHGGKLVLKSGDYFRTFAIDQNGRFETFSLVPGTYEIRFEIFAHSTLGPELIIEDGDVELQLTSQRLLR